MPFTLQVELSGLCAYFQHPDGERVGVVMPDCRHTTNPVRYHADRTPAEPHAGYVRFDLADVVGSDASLPAGAAATGPRYELVHRFDAEALEFDGLAAEAMTVSLGFPEILAVAPNLMPRPDLFGTSPQGVVARCILRGGDLVAPDGTELWEIPGRLNGGSPVTGKFASFATWTRTVPGENVLVRIRDFAGTDRATFTLQPRVAGGTVLVKLSNLCAHNPLEWNELELRQVYGDDQDFKWLYRLLAPSDGSTYLQILQGYEFPCPARALGGQETASDDCIGTVVKSSFTDPNP
jgi:hypothetical protein